MLTYYTKRSQNETVQTYRTPPSSGGWAAGQRISKEELDYLIDRYQLDAATAYDALDRHELPRAEYVDGKLYLFLRTPHRVKHGEVVSSPLLIVVGAEAFITVSVADFDLPLDQSASIQSFEAKTAGQMVCLMLASVVGVYETHVRRTARFIRDTGHRLRSHEATNRDFIRFVTVEDNLNQFEMDLSGLKAVLCRLHEDSRLPIDQTDYESVDDMAQHVEQLLVSINSYSQSVTSIRNAYSTVANNILNQRMKTLTIITVLIALPNVFYGMYGMNVALPFAEQPWAFAAMVAFTVLLILLVLVIAKRSRIL